MAGRGLWSRKFLLGFLVVLLLVGGMAWMERAQLLAWFYLHRLSLASEDQRQPWVERVAGLGEGAVPGLLACLARPDSQACGNARAALECLSTEWGEADPRTGELAQQLAREFARLSSAGRQEVLGLATNWFAQQPAPAGMLPAAARLLGEAASIAEPDVLGAALETCAAVLDQPEHSEAVRPAQDLIRAGLHSSAAANRLRAVRLALHAGMDLLEPVTALLSDPEPEVRRAALLVVGPAHESVPDECLLPCLHDSDAEVRRLCEVALGGRGLRPEYVQLGRLLTDPRAANRLQVLDHLANADLDPGLWLRRLSHDPSPAVRVAAMRAMSQMAYVDLSDRLDQMARSDPSPTVAQLARYYLSRPKPGRAEGPEE
jgi:hypothetical protein